MTVSGEVNPANMYDVQRSCLHCNNGLPTLAEHVWPMTKHARYRIKQQQISMKLNAID